MSAVAELEAQLRVHLDPRVSLAAAWLDAVVPPLWPEEAPYAEPAVERRRQELTVGRHLARRLLEARGVPPGPILRREDRTAIWPEGFMGSITHSKDVVMVGIADRSEVPWLGLDVEKSRLSEGLVTRILREDERGALEGLSPEAAQLHATVVFSAKEAFYKAQYPHTETYLGFLDVRLDFAADGRALHAVVVKPDSPIKGLELAGFWVEAGPWIASAFTRGAT